MHVFLCRTECWSGGLFLPDPGIVLLFGASWVSVDQFYRTCDDVVESAVRGQVSYFIISFALSYRLGQSPTDNRQKGNDWAALLPALDVRMALVT